MVIERTSPQKDSNKLNHFENNDFILIVTLIISLLTLLFIVYTEYYRWNFSWLIRYLALIPVLFISYHYGVLPGIFSASLFCILYLPELSLQARSNWSSFQTIQILFFMILLQAASYIVSNVVMTFKKEQTLSETVMEWGELLFKMKDIDEMILFILAQSKELINVETTQLLLRDPLSAEWEIITGEKKRLSLHELLNMETTLYEWILSQDNEYFFNHLDRIPSIFIRTGENNLENRELVSFLVYPLRLQEGSLLGQLIFINKNEGNFQENDFLSVKGLIVGSERALEQAGLYAKTDYSLARRVDQLGAIQRTARKLNETLNTAEILEKTLECALEITNAEKGIIYLANTETKPIIRSKGDYINKEIYSIIEKLHQEQIQDDQMLGHEFQLPSSIQNSYSRLLVSIRKENKLFGYLLVESSSQLFSRDSLRHVLSILADHASIALENSRLFQEIQSDQQRFSMIINSLSEGVFTTDNNGIIITYNPAADNYLGKELSQGTGKVFCNILQFHGEDHSFGDCILLRSVKSKQPLFERKIKINISSGREKTLAISITPIPTTQGHPEGAVFTVRDITVQEENEQLQRDLIAAISHELRAPLANINTITETMMSYSDEPPYRPFIGYLTRLITQTQRLATFSDRILDVYQMETGKIKIQLRPIPIHLLVTQIVNQWQTNVSRSISCSFQEKKSPWIWGDEKAIESVLNNLIENAVKYSYPDSKINVIVESPNKNLVICGVKDQGVGISPDLQEKIFERFYRINSGDSQKIYGHGLGLYISKHLVEAMNGNIWVDSEVGKGSYFKFSLPLMEEQNER